MREKTDMLRYVKQRLRVAPQYFYFWGIKKEKYKNRDETVVSLVNICWNSSNLRQMENY